VCFGYYCRSWQCTRSRMVGGSNITAVTAPVPAQSAHQVPTSSRAFQTAPARPSTPVGLTNRHSFHTFTRNSLILLFIRRCMLLSVSKLITKKAPLVNCIVDDGWLTMQLTSGASVFVHACRQMADSLSNCCKKQHACLHSIIWQH